MTGTVDHSAMIATFGPPGVGKTVDQVLAYPDSYVLALPGALSGVRHIVGEAAYQAILGQTATVTDLEGAVMFLEQMASGQYPPKPVLIDDGTVMSDATLTRLRGLYPASHVFAMWGHYDGIIQNLRAYGRTLGVPVRMTFHERPAATDTFGQTVKGGIEAGGKRAKGRLEAVLDVVYGVIQDSERWPHPSRYVCRRPDAYTEYKDRFAMITGDAPMNLREIARASGRLPVAPRVPGLEWLDTAADDVAAALDAASADRQAIGKQAFAALVARGAERGHAYWAVRDGLDRHELCQSGDVFDAMFNPPTKADAAPASPFGSPPPA